MNNQQPLVSINITTFNRSKVIGRCIDSLLKQEYDNFEILVIDDFSTDDTEEVVKKYIEKDNRIKYHKHSKNKGLSKARNTGFNLSNGKYVATVDDDDEWIDNEKLKKQVKIFEEDTNHKIAIVCSSTRIITETGWHDNIIEKPTNLILHILKGNSLIYTTTALIRKSSFDLIGGFDIKLKKGIDSDFYRRLIVNHGLDVYFLKDITTNTNEYGDDRITSDFSKAKLKYLIFANLYIIKKHWFSFIINPKAFVFRIKNIIKYLIKLTKNDI